jgi:hypothetical protein
MIRMSPRNRGAESHSPILAPLWAIVAILFLALSPGGAIALDGGPTQSKLPASVLGTWKVASVLVDLGSSRTFLYQRDDPNLLGRTFTIGDQKIESNTPEARECGKPRSAIWRTTAEELIAVTLAPHGLPSIKPTVHDYELPLSPSASVEALSVQCEPGRFGPRPLKAARAVMGSRNGTWIVVLPSGLLAIRWYDETILLLRRANE